MPGARIRHVHVDGIDEHHGHSANFAKGELEARSSLDPEFAERYFGHQHLLWNRSALSPAVARPTVSILARELRRSALTDRRDLRWLVTEVSSRLPEAAAGESAPALAGAAPIPLERVGGAPPLVKATPVHALPPSPGPCGAPHPTPTGSRHIPATRLRTCRSAITRSRRSPRASPSACTDSSSTRAGRSAGASPSCGSGSARTHVAAGCASTPEASESHRVPRSSAHTSARSGCGPRASANRVRSWSCPSRICRVTSPW